jgi:hypothetical protein
MKLVTLVKQQGRKCFTISVLSISEESFNHA